MFCEKLAETELSRKIFFRLLTDRRWLNHTLKDHLKRHGVAASSACMKKVTITHPMTVLVFYGMRVIGPIKGYRKGTEMNAVFFLGVALGFLNLSDHARIHGCTTPFGLCGWMQKSTR
jgi:hypothetical protein